MGKPIGNILNIARTSLVAQRKAMEVTSHNLSNANTEGYTRQRANLVAGEPTPMPTGIYGTGVRVDDVERVRDRFLDASFRDQAASASYSEQRSDLLGRVEGALNEPSDSGLSSTLDAFWSAWSDLANNPTSSTARSSVQERGRQVAETFHQIDAKLDSVKQDAESRLQGQLRTLNEKAARVAELNSRIVSAESGGHTAADLRDDRDRALDRMADIVDIRAREQSNGSVTVFTDGLNLVDGDQAESLESSVNPGTGRIEIGVVGKSRVIDSPGGSAGAVAEFVNDTLPGYVSRLDTLAGSIVTEINAIHTNQGNPEEGVNPNGNFDVDFFADAGAGTDDRTAGGIELSAAVDGDPQEIVAGSGDGSQNYLAGTNDVALQLAGLRDDTLAGLGGKSVSGYYSSEVVGQVGVDASQAQKSAEADGALLSQISTRRSSQHGVSTDEEMVDLIRHQQAFTAAARLVTTADEMMQTVLEMKR